MTGCWKAVGWLGAIAVISVVSAGCPKRGTGPPTARLRGAVTLKGGPIPADADARIRFDPAEIGDARPASAIIGDGKYDVEDAPVGKVRVTFSINQPTGEVKGEGDRQERTEKSLVPESFRGGQEIQVDGDNSNLNFDLK